MTIRHLKPNLNPGPWDIDIDEINTNGLRFSSNYIFPEQMSQY
jgi:hypothetical protein